MEFGHRNADIFDEIYRRRCWGGQAADGELYSGPGTYDPSVAQYVDFVLGFIEQREISTIVEIGSHAELLAKDGYYSQLYKLQFKSQE